MLNWQFEGSADKESWDVLDRRIYLSDDPVANAEMAEIRNMLKKKGATSTWEVDSENIRDPRGGYRYFRIVQVGRNSSGSDNLSLSGMELYGKIVAGRFP